MISLVTALYKSDRYLPAYMDKLLPFTEALEHRGVNFEIIFVPQQPTELEKRTLDSISAKSWFRYRENEKPSLYAAWNTGTFMAKGDVVGFWNADDVRFVDAVLEAERGIQNGIDVIYFPFIIKRYLRLFDHDFHVHTQRIDKQIPSAFDRQEFTSGMNCGPHFMFRREIFMEIGPFDEQFKIVGDFDWCVRAAKHTDKFTKGKNLSGTFRVDGRGLSAGGKPKHVAENNIVYMRHGIPGKIQPVDPGIIQVYKPKQVLFRGQWYDAERAADCIR